MPHLWVQTIDGDWKTAPLTDTAYQLSDTEPVALGDTVPGQSLADFPWLVRTTESQEPTWSLLSSARSHARVNGSPVALGIRVLDDRDEIVVGGPASDDTRRCFFSTERLVVVEPFPGAAQPVHCPRCKQEIHPGTFSVQCPHPTCRMWHHQTKDLPCWSYAATCASPACDQPTDTKIYRWTPEDL